MEKKQFLLTQYSHGAGCGCKIAPQILDTILNNSFGKHSSFDEPRLLVGHDKKDDAAVFDLGNGRAVISTTDFFMPIVDDAFNFGQIAAVNAISDVYAMGGNPLLAIAILGWPISKLPADQAARVLEGARAVCAKAGIPLAGGHSIDNPEPLFGLAVTGEAPIANIRRNSTATKGCALFLTKPIGIGILTTAQKKGVVNEVDLKIAIDTMLELNKVGALLGTRAEVKAMTDITGFGLLGHLGEMIDAGNLSTEISFSSIPLLPNLDKYIDQQCIPGGTLRNWKSYGDGIIGLNALQQTILADPQTSGGLLVAVDHEGIPDFKSICNSANVPVWQIGSLSEKNPNYRIRIAP